MGWGNCGQDSRGRNIGYSFGATCDHEGCKKRIDRGLSYACGGMHGTSDGCEGYFCGDHMWHMLDPQDSEWKQFCKECAAEIERIQMEEFVDVARNLGIEITDPTRYESFELIQDEIVEALNISKDLTPGQRGLAYSLLSTWDELDGLDPREDMPTHIFSRVSEMAQRRATYGRA